MKRQVELTTREQEALDLLLEGIKNKEIGRRMRPSMTEGSVKNLLIKVYDKLGMKTRAEIIAHYKN